MKLFGYPVVVNPNLEREVVALAEAERLKEIVRGDLTGAIVHRLDRDLRGDP